MNAYSYKGKKLSHLIYEIAKIKELKRIRYTTSHPRDLTDDLIQAHGMCEKLMPLIHLPIQSGSNKILANMNRKHTTQEYIYKINKLKKVRPSIKFSSDFIIGYPGESEKDFRETLQIMTDVKFINSFSFIFNARPGTPAAKFKTVDEKIAKQRLFKFQEISTQIKKNYRKQLLNKTSLVLFENKTKIGNNYFGRDEYYNSVIVASNDNLVGKIKRIKIVEINNNTMFGNINIQDNKQEDFAA